jgi:Type VI immunity for VRR-NUC
MRYRGMDIAWPSLERAAVLHDSVRSVGWLTVLCDAFVKRLGGATAVRTLKAPVEVMDVPRGVLLKAGATPTVGDVNRGDELAAYRHVFRMLQPLIEPVIPRYPTFSLRADRRDNTTAWLRRLADAP